MSFFSKFNGGKSKAAKMEKLAAQFDAGKDAFLKIILEGLSNSDQRERQDCANLLRDKVIPALELDTSPDSKQASLATIKKLISELRPPCNDGEMNDLNNAAFHYMRLQLQQRSE